MYSEEKELTINDRFIKLYHDMLEENAYLNDEDEIHKTNRLTGIPEFTYDNLNELIDIYLTSKTLDEANDNFRKYIESIVPDAKIDWKSDNYADTPEYKQHKYSLNVSRFFSEVSSEIQLEEEWVKKNGKRHTDEEAAKIATEKMMELCFGWHLQDNGALDEEHSFMMSSLATVYGEAEKSKISEDVKKKAYDLCYGFFLGYLKFIETLYYKFDYEHIDDYRNWLRENLPSPDKDKFNWNNIYGELECDYDPNWAWHLILKTAGVDENSVRLICPWKTSISIRSVDNTVLYRTYRNCEYL